MQHQIIIKPPNPTRLMFAPHLAHPAAVRLSTATAHGVAAE
jgi:hypothetical protein